MVLDERLLDNHLVRVFLATSHLHSAELTVTNVAITDVKENLICYTFQNVALLFAFLEIAIDRLSISMGSVTHDHMLKSTLIFFRTTQVCSVKLKVLVQASFLILLDDRFWCRLCNNLLTRFDVLN